MKTANEPWQEKEVIGPCARVTTNDVRAVKNLTMKQL